MLYVESASGLGCKQASNSQVIEHFNTVQLCHVNLKIMFNIACIRRFIVVKS